MVLIVFLVHFSKAFKNWKDATRSFEKHVGKSGCMSLHSRISAVLLSIQQQLSGHAQPIDMLVHEKK